MAVATRAGDFVDSEDVGSGEGWRLLAVVAYRFF